MNKTTKDLLIGLWTLSAIIFFAAGLKLDGIINLSWLLIFSPVWLPVAGGILFAIGYFFILLASGIYFALRKK